MSIFGKVASLLGGGKESVAGQAVGIIDKLVNDKDLATQLKAELKVLILGQTNNITRFVRGFLAISLWIKWLYFTPEGVELTPVQEYGVYGIIAFYFLVDFYLDSKKK